MKNLKIAIMLSIFALSSGANASLMTISGPGSAVEGDSFQLQILGDFTGEGLIAGGLTFAYDPSLVQLDLITLNLPVVNDFSCPGSVNCPPPVAGSAPIVWGEFLSDLIGAADPAPVLMATLDFTAIDAPGLAVFSMLDNPALTGGWFGAGFNPIPTPGFGAHTMELLEEVSQPECGTPGGPACPVPEPGTIALFGLGLAGLGFARRKKA